MLEMDIDKESVRRRALELISRGGHRVAARLGGEFGLSRQVANGYLQAMAREGSIEAEGNHVRRLSLFGSQLKGTARPDSDIDLLVEFDPGHIPGLLGIAGMEIELSEMLGRRKVDLRTAQDLSRHFRDEVVRRADVQYAR